MPRLSESAGASIRPAPLCEFTTSQVPCSLQASAEGSILAHPVAQFIDKVHSSFAQAWSDETAHPAYRPVPPPEAGRLPTSPSQVAYGQCVPTTAVAFECLQDRFPEETFSIESGFVYRRMRSKSSLVDIDSHKHVWLHWTPAMFESVTLNDICVVDMTSGQFEGGPVVVQSVHNLVLNGLIYQSLRRFDNLDAFYRQFSQREPDVRNRVNWFRKRVLPAGYLETR